MKREEHVKKLIEDYKTIFGLKDNEKVSVIKLPKISDSFDVKKYDYVGVDDLEKKDNCFIELDKEIELNIDKFDKNDEIEHNKDIEIFCNEVFSDNRDFINAFLSSKENVHKKGEDEINFCMIPFDKVVKHELDNTIEKIVKKENTFCSKKFKDDSLPYYIKKHKK